ncbi:dethiobiotin synthase [Nitrosophilus kaiyonis]|uniref:dethiobiotin synthase n=1 Tax=Nitrosophilus kaiyonis TaxID=2930200 RepID=UPI00249062E0|nr:dethiobiotin synthase [Nitrosophilus kaiyonis]
MSKRVFITATNTGIGKTFTTLSLLQECETLGIKAGVFKPIETGVAQICNDGTKLLEKCQEFNNNFRKFMVGDIVPYRFTLPAAPYVAKKDIKIDIDFLLEKIDILEKECDVLFIEGAGGLMVPVEKDIFMIDLIKIFDSTTLLVTPSRLGCINDTLLSIEALKRRDINFEWCVNLYEDKDSFYEVTFPFYKDYFEEILILQNDRKKILERLLSS